MTRHSQGIVDRLDFAPVLEQQGKPGIKFTFTVPTDVTGQTDSKSVLTLKNRVREAKNHLVESGLREVDAHEFLAPVSRLLDDSSYWRLQSRGLVIFLAEDYCLPVRVPIELRDTLTISEDFNLLPLAPVIASDRKIYLLALAKNAVRLFESSRNVITELPLDNVPASFDDVIDELPERNVDVRAGAGGTDRAPIVQGSGGDMDRVLLEKFIHAVGQAIGTRLGTARSQRLVLAAVAEYLPIFKDACPYPAIFDGVIAGNPERAEPDDLRSAAWQLISDEVSAHEGEEHDRARSLAHGGKGSSDITDIAHAASEGRVDTLYLPRESDADVSDDARKLANRALIDTIKGSGVIRTLGALDGQALATFRY